MRERVHRALRKLERGIADPAGARNPECATLVERMAEQKPLLRSLRTEVRDQAREKMNALTNTFRERGC